MGSVEVFLVAGTAVLSFALGFRLGWLVGRYAAHRAAAGGAAVPTCPKCGARAESLDPVRPGSWICTTPRCPNCLLVVAGEPVGGR